MYKRPDLQPAKEHPIQEHFGIHGLIKSQNDPPWISPHLQGLMDDGNFALFQVLSAIDTVEKMDLSELRPEVAQARRNAKILEAKRMILPFLKKHIGKNNDSVNAVYNKILRVTEPVSEKDPVQAMLQELRNQEIRKNLREIEPRYRVDAIKGNLARIQACISNPDPADQIISAEHLIEIRRHYAFSQDPTLELEEKDQQEICDAVKRRAGEINATAIKMLLGKKMDVDLPPEEIYEVFPPLTDHEKYYAEKRIQDFHQAREREKVEMVGTFGFEQE